MRCSSPNRPVRCRAGPRGDDSGGTNDSTRLCPACARRACRGRRCLGGEPLDEPPRGAPSPRSTRALAWRTRGLRRSRPLLVSANAWPPRESCRDARLSRPDGAGRERGAGGRQSLEARVSGGGQGSAIGLLSWALQGMHEPWTHVQDKRRGGIVGLCLQRDSRARVAAGACRRLCRSCDDSVSTAVGQRVV